MSEIQPAAPAAETSAPPPAAPEPAPTPEATAEPSQPQSSHDVVEQALKKLEYDDADRVADDADDEAPPPARETAAPKPKPTPTPAVEASEEERLLQEFGFKDARREDGREHRIPRSKVLSMIGTGLKRGQAKWDGERTAINRELETTRADLTAIANDINTLEPRAFIEKLAQHRPAYRSLLEPVHAVTPSGQPPADDPEPQPDVDLGNGRWTFSLDGLNKLRAWDKRQLKRDMDAAKQAEREEADRRAQQQESLGRHFSQKAKEQMERAQTWSLFGKVPEDGSLTPFQQRVFDAMQSNEGFDLRDAYIHVMEQDLPRLMEDDAAKRARLIQEANEAPKSTAVTPRPPQTRTTGPRSSADVVREALARLERQ